MAERVDADAGDEIEVAAFVDVIDPAALATRQHERIAGVVLEQVTLFEIEDRLRGIGRLSRGRGIRAR